MSCSCSAVSFTLNFSAPIVVFSSPPDPQNETSVNQFAQSALALGGIAPNQGFSNISGPFTITGTYCAPATAVRHDTLQVLVHGITYNKTMWTGLGYGSQYDWPAYAASRGYHTLAIDRLGNGHPHATLDPIGVVQAPIQVEILHQLLVVVRNGQSSPLPRSFGKIVYVGHSFGSMFGVAVAAKYPEDTDALVLTGYSSSLVFPWPSWPFNSVASIAPERYAGTAPGYLSFATEGGRQTSFYAGNYDQRIPAGDFLYEDILTAGELATFGFIVRPATCYAKPVFVVAGTDDIFFCSASSGKTCDTILAETSTTFPKARVFDYRAIGDTGHDLTLHRTSLEVFGIVHDWMQEYVC